ncbi:hypothetical protein GW17_00001256 [Ensete ventricosum]|nr:hypothetical protein GW17_00001256 [Ensete ventricosum]RZS19543.1 hypothetical protein BHM03_00051942 [Ensete ventricosum]
MASTATHFFFVTSYCMQCLFSCSVTLSLSHSSILRASTMRDEVFRGVRARKPALRLLLVFFFLSLLMLLAVLLAAGGKESEEATGAAGGGKEELGRVFRLPPVRPWHDPVKALLRGSERRVPHASDPLHNR